MPPERKAWLVMAVTFWASIAVSINRFKVPPVMHTLMHELDIGMVTGGWLMSSVAVATVILAIPSAFLLTRLGPKILGLIALGCTVVGSVIGGFSSSVTPLLLGRVVEGVGVGLITVVAPALISMWFPARRRGLPMGIWTSWVPVGNVIIFNVAQPLSASMGWRGVWWFGTGAALSAFVAFGLLVSAPPSAERGYEANPRRDHSFGRMLFHIPSWILALAFATFAFSLIAYNTWAPSYLSETLGVDASEANFYASLLFVAAIPANVIAGWLMNRTRHRYRLLATAFVIAGLLYVWSFSLPTIAIAILYMLALGFATNFIPTSLYTLAPQTMPTLQLAGLALAMVTIGSGVGALTGPPFLGSILESGNWTTGSACLVAVTGLGVIVSIVAAIRMEKT